MRTIDDLTPEEDAMLSAIAIDENPWGEGAAERCLWLMGLIGGYLDTPLPSVLQHNEEPLLEGWLRGRRVGDRRAKELVRQCLNR